MEEIIKELISRVNSTLNYYEKDYISVQRYPMGERERCESFEQYIEARFNYECCRIPEFYDAVIATNGRLFSCTGLVDPDVVKRRFTSASVTLIDPKTLPGASENLIKEINDIQAAIGGSSIKFNNVKKKIKFFIE